MTATHLNGGLAMAVYSDRTLFQKIDWHRYPAPLCSTWFRMALPLDYWKARGHSSPPVAQ